MRSRIIRKTVKRGVNPATVVQNKNRNKCFFYCLIFIFSFGNILLVSLIDASMVGLFQRICFDQNPAVL